MAGFGVFAMGLVEGSPYGLHRVQIRDDRRPASLQKVESATLDIVDTQEELALGNRMANLTGAGDVEQGRTHPMVGVLHRPLPLVRHMTIRTGDARTRVDALVVELELRMLRLQHLGPSRRDEDRVVDEALVTANAVVLEQPGVPLRDLNRLVEVPHRECPRMIPPVDGLGQVFADEIRRRMALIANGDVVVSRLLPRVIDIVHDVAVHARSRIVRHVGEAAGVAEGEEPEAEHQSREDGEDERWGCGAADQGKLVDESEEREVAESRAGAWIGPRPGAVDPKAGPGRHRGTMCRGRNENDCQLH